MNSDVSKDNCPQLTKDSRRINGAKQVAAADVRRNLLLVGCAGTGEGVLGIGGRPAEKTKPRYN
jgi:hypothetical protein